MVLLALWSALEAAPPTSRSALLLLPPSSEVASIRAEAVEAALAEALRAHPVVTVRTLNAAQRATLQADPGCVNDRACLAALAGSRVDALLKSSVQVHNGLLSVDLSLLDPAGAVVQRVAIPITAPSAAQLSPALPALVLVLDRDAADYARAVSGDADAAARLRARAPNSPWALALPASPAAP
jgi:hypothetical protein